MSNQDLFKAVMSVVHRTSTPHVAASRYSGPNSNILGVAITLESVQKGWDTPLVESHNQQQISWWVRSHICLPSLQRKVYTEWELHTACERSIVVKLTYADLIGEFGVPKSIICQTLNVLLPPLKITSLKHLWDLIAIGDVKKKIVRGVTRLTKKWKSNLPPQRQGSINLGKIRNGWSTWTTKRYKQPHKWAATNAPFCRGKKSSQWNFNKVHNFYAWKVIELVNEEEPKAGGPKNPGKAQ